MRIGSSIVLIILAAASLWYAKDAFTPADPAATPPAIGETLIRFEPATISSIDIVRQGQRAHIERDARGAWQMDSPINDRVDFQALLALMVSLNGMIIEDGFELEEVRKNHPAELTDYGLADNGVDVILRNNRGESIARFRIGSLAPLSVNDIPTTYVQRLDREYKNRIFVVGGNLRLIVDRPFETWRDQRPLFLPRPPLKIRIAQGQRQIELSRKTADSPWVMESPLSTAADQDAVSTLLASLSEPIATDIVALDSNEQAATAAKSISIWMQKHSAAKLVKGNPALDEKPITLTLLPIKPEEESLTLLSNDRKSALMLPTTAEQAFDLDSNRYRSRTLANIDPAKIFNILIRDPAEASSLVQLRRRGREWEVMLRGEWKRSNDKLIFETLTAINETNIVNFAADGTTDYAQFGLDQPILQAAFISLEESNAIRLNIGRNEDGKHFAKFDGQPFIYEVPDALAFLLPTNPGAWLSTIPFNFSALDLRQVKITQQEWAPLTLRYNYLDSLWIGLLGEKDVTPQLNTVSAHEMAAQLERLQVDRWSTTVSGDALRKLSEPILSVEFQVVPTEADGTEGKVVEHTIDFTPVNKTSKFWLGRIDKRPEVFLIDVAKLALLFPQSLLSPQ